MGCSLFNNLGTIHKNYRVKEKGQAMKSNHYKLVNKITKVIEAQGSAAEMRKLRKKDPNQYVIYLSSSTNIGDKVS